MNLSDFLLHATRVGDLVQIYDDGWYVGCTIIDNEDLFISSLNPELLRRKVKSSNYEKKDWTTRSVLGVEIE